MKIWQLFGFKTEKKTHNSNNLKAWFKRLSFFIAAAIKTTTEKKRTPTTHKDSKNIVQLNLSVRDDVNICLYREWTQFATKMNL